MSAEECKHLLNPAWCAECNGTVAQQKADEEAERTRVLALGGWFPAQFRGLCGGCGQWFSEGTPITLRDEVDAGSSFRYLAMCCAPAGDPA